MLTLHGDVVVQLLTWAAIVSAVWLMFQAYVWDQRRKRERLGYSAHRERFASVTEEEAARRPYVVFDPSHDEVVPADSLVAPERARQLRADVDAYLHRLAPLPAASVERVKAMVSRGPTTAVTLLIDNSGSMRGEPIASAASTADLLCATLEDSGSSVEVLGYTTAGWRGGAAREHWIEHGEPPFPGRLCVVRHIVYKAGDATGAAARQSLSVMTDETLLKENIDGEALLWACGRLTARAEARRILIVLSDGAPVDDATLAANDDWFLIRHLKSAIATIEADASVHLAAVGIAHDVSQYYAHSVFVSETSDLPAATFDVLIAALERSPVTGPATVT